MRAALRCISAHGEGSLKPSKNSFERVRILTYGTRAARPRFTRHGRPDARRSWNGCDVLKIERPVSKSLLLRRTYLSPSPGFVYILASARLSPLPRGQS